MISLLLAASHSSQQPGQELLGKKVVAPTTKYKYVHILPLPTIKMDKVTGVSYVVDIVGKKTIVEPFEDQLSKSFGI